MITYELFLKKNCPACISLKKFTPQPKNSPLTIKDSSKFSTSCPKNYKILPTFPILIITSEKKGKKQLNSFLKKIKLNDDSLKVYNSVVIKEIITGSKKINQILSKINKIKLNKYGSKLTGSNIDINYYNDNQANIKYLREYRGNCFGNTCHIMDRPFGPMDNQYLLQNYQPKCAIPTRSDLPVKTKFGTTPGTNEWKAERKPWIQSQISLLNCNQNNNGLNINYPLQYSNNSANKTCSTNSTSQLENSLKNNLVPKSKFGYVSALNNDNAPYLTYGGGGTTKSRISNTMYLEQQNPIKLQSPGFINGDINNTQSQMLKNGLNSKWSLNAQGLNKFGDDITQFKDNNNNNPVLSNEFRTTKTTSNPWNLTETAFNSDQGNFSVAQYFKRDMFPFNGNGNFPQTQYGKKFVNKFTDKKSKKSKKLKKSSNSTQSNTFLSPLGIEISF